MKISHEPAALIGLAHAAILLASAFGANLSGGQVAAIGSFLAALGAVIARQATVPKAKLNGNGQ